MDRIRDWIAAGGFDTFVSWAGILSALLALIAVLQASWLNFKANQPAVAVRLTHSAAIPEVMEISIRNYGPTMAENIRLESEERPVRPADNDEDDPQELELYDREWTLAPGEEWRTVWASFNECKRLNTDLAMTGTASCDAQGRPWFWFFQNKRLTFPYVIDLAMYEGRTRMDEYTVHRIGKDVHRLAQWNGGPNPDKPRIRRFRGTLMTKEEMDEYLTSRLQSPDGTEGEKD